MSAIVAIYFSWVFISPTKLVSLPPWIASARAEKADSISSQNPKLLILGGSSADLGISAEIIENHTEYSAFNLALPPYGGGSYEAYIDYIKHNLSDVQKENVKYVVWSPVQLLHGDMISSYIAGRDEFGRVIHPWYLPQNSFLDFLTYKSNSSDTFTWTEHGDAITFYQGCKKDISESSVLRPDLDEATQFISSFTHFLKKTFVNASIAVVIPALLLDKKQNQSYETYVRYVSEIIDRVNNLNSDNDRKIKLLALTPFPDASYACFDGDHASPKGRDFNTSQIVKFLNKETNGLNSE